MKYFCKGCDSIITRDSKKAWVTSFCSKAGKKIRMMRRPLAPRGRK